ncbi:GTP-binding protein [bacterium]|nr:GTP-binding protein [bacterium]
MRHRRGARIREARARSRTRVGVCGLQNATPRARDDDAMASDDARAYDHLVKILLVGDSGVGKSSLLARFISDSFDEQSPTVGVDFKLKHVDVDGTRLKLTVWDTAGQERFRTLTSSYYRGAHGVVFVYDVTSRESFENARETWRKEVEMYGTIANSVKIVIGNKIDKEDERTVAREEGVAFAKEYGCLFLECSAKTKVRVAEAFDELVKGILDAPGLLVDEIDDGVKLGAYVDRAGGGCC